MSRKQKKKTRKGLLRDHQNDKLHKHKPSLMLIVSYTLSSLALLVQLMQSLTFDPELHAFKTITSMTICKQCLRKYNVLQNANVDFLLNDSLVKSMRNSSHNPSSITTVLFKSTGTPVLHPFQHCKCL